MRSGEGATHSRSAFDAMESMIGIAPAKAGILDLALEPNDLPTGVVFAGNSGTGKSAAARHLAHILTETRALESGWVTTAGCDNILYGDDPYPFIAHDSVERLFLAARGGVLHLARPDRLDAEGPRQDRGVAFLDALEQRMMPGHSADPERRTLVVASGPAAALAGWLSRRPALSLLFQKIVPFPDLDLADLSAIFLRFMETHRLGLVGLGRADIEAALERLRAARLGVWRNAKECETLFLAVLSAQGERVIAEMESGGAGPLADLRSVIASDLRAAEEALLR